jgi:hypothetical protein
MMRVVLSISSCVLVLGLVACDKKTDAKSAEAKTEDKKEEPTKEPAAKQDEKPVAEAKAEPVAEGTKGVGGVIHATAGDEKPVEAAPTEAASVPAEVPHFDTSKDQGSMIGHLAGSLAHDDSLAAAKDAMVTLASLALNDTTPTDAELCGHVWTTVFVKEFPEMADEALKAEFLQTCKLEIEKERLKLGPEVFAEAAACIMKAETLEAIGVCDKAEKQAEQELHEKPKGDGLDRATCEAAIDHMFALLRKEMGAEPELIAIIEADLANLRADGITMCMDEASKAEVECLMKAQDLASLSSCET